LRNPRDAQHHGITIIHQELQLVPELTIAENIFLGREHRTSLGFLDKRRMKNESRAYLDRLHLSVSPDRTIKGLRVGERQLVEIAKALSLNASLLIFDEPTSALNETEIKHLFDIIQELKKSGVTMIYISHKFAEIFQIADQVTVLRDGEYVGTQFIAQTSERELIQMMVGRTIQDLYPKEAILPGSDVLRVESLYLSQERSGSRSLRNISFTLRQGEIVGVAGLLGAGRTELLEALFGVYPRSRIRGRIIVGEQEKKFISPHEAILSGLAFVTEDRKSQSLVMSSSVEHNISIAALKRFMTYGFIRHRQEREAVQVSIKHLRIKVPNAMVNVGTLSGGNQQKVVLAKGLLTNPRVLLLDEPTRGIDIGAKAEIYNLIGQLAKDGAGILLASSELTEILAICDRILVLSEGQLTAEFSRAEATQEKIMEAATINQRAQPAYSIHGGN
jgi:ABC-type sugar transport system ATPase subunit